MRKQTLFLLFLLGALQTSGASVHEYFFQNFEIENGWEVGPITENTADFEVIQGKASILHAAEEGSSQILALEENNPFSTVFLDASHFASSEIVYCELLVKPSAMNDLRDEEFLDFNGAILGFFGDSEIGQIQVLSSKTENQSVWISTGIDYPLDTEGCPENWIQVRIRIDIPSRRWSLTIDDELVLDGLKLLNYPSKVLLPLFLYGHAKEPNKFDDVLLSTLPPKDLEAMLSELDIVRKKYKKSQNTTTHPKFISKTKANSSVRHGTQSIRDLRAKSPVLKIRKIKFDLTTSRNNYKTDSEKDTPMIAYSPSYDEEGNKKPAVLSVAADVNLEPGVKLRDLKWRLVHLKGWPDEYGETFARGNFRTGLLQKITIEPAWQEVATLVIVEVLPD